MRWTFQGSFWQSLTWSFRAGSNPSLGHGSVFKGEQNGPQSPLTLPQDGCKSMFWPLNMGRALNTTFFFFNFSGTSRQESRQKSRQKVLVFLGSEGHTELFGPHPFTWKTRTPPEDIQTKKFGFGFLFLPWQEGGFVLALRLAAQLLILLTAYLKDTCVGAEKTMTATDVTGFDEIFSTGFFATFSRF